MRTKKLQTLIRKGRLLLMVVALSLPVMTYAQFPGDPGDDPDPTPVPFDGGIGALIAAGAAYAIKKRHDNKKKKQEDQNSSSL